LRQLYPDIGFSKALLDSAHDAYEIYRLLSSHAVEAFIDLNDRRGQKPKFSAFKINKFGKPICIENIEMINCGFIKERSRIKWRCPMYKQLDRHPKKQECSPSAYGRVVYTKPDDDLRLFTKTSRDSKAWKKIYAKRTSVERTLKRILVDYDIENLRLRAEKRWFWFATLAGINQHLVKTLCVFTHLLMHRLLF